MIRELIHGETIRDWRIDSNQYVLTPYRPDLALESFDSQSGWGRHLWLFRTTLSGILSFGGRTRAECGDAWWAWYRWVPDKYRVPLSITFAEIATHNHFALDQGGRVFNQSAPVINPDVTKTQAARARALATRS